MIEHTYIDFFGWELADPLTFLSDILMASFCAFFGHRLFHNFKSKYTKLAALFFLTLSLSSFLGGFSHLLDAYFGKPLHLMAWSVQGVSVLFFQLSSLTLLNSSKSEFILKTVVFVLFILFVFLLLSIQEFDIVKLNSTIGLIGIVSTIHIYKYFQERRRLYLKIPLVLLLFAGPAMIHSFGISINSWINHNVISHVLLVPCYYLLFRTFIQVDGIAKTTPLAQETPLN